MTPIRFFATGLPKGQPRPRAFARKFGDKYSARVYDAGTAEGWKSQVALAARPSLPSTPIDFPLLVTLIFYLPRPAAHFGSGKNKDKRKDSSPRFPCGKPDCDNLAKAVLDALTMLGMWKDDNLIIQLDIQKRYVTSDRLMGCLIGIQDTEGLVG